MAEICVSDVKIRPAQIRRNAGDITELANSIKEIGQIHAIVLDDDNFIIAGYRRYLAHQKLGLMTIRFERFSGLDEITRKRIELEENTKRLNLSWQEEVSAKRELHLLMQEIHGAAVFGGKGGGWGLVETAKMLGQSTAQTSIDLRLAEALEVAPQIANAPLKGAAISVLKKLKENAILRELAKRSVTTQNPETRLWGLYHGDCLQVIPEIPELTKECVDLVLCDPPYGINYSPMDGEGFHDGYYAASKLLEKLCPQISQLLVPGGHCYLFTSPELLPAASAFLQSAGLEVRPRPLVWVKRIPTPGSVGSGGFMNRYELIIHAWKDVPRPLTDVSTDVLEYSAPDVNSRLHPTEKPLDLLRRIIELSTEPGQLVFDPTCGSGSTLAAATLCGRRSIGIEESEVFYNAALGRLTGGI